MFIDESIVGFYKLNFQIISGHYGITLTELENMIPFEREVFTHLIINKIQEKNNQLQE